ncbi:sensor histidine kinase [Leucobacter luti]|nr:HAMP domain-containing sensor histidine kinase [Leucobacter luti]MBL3700037.1 sensor histidine kinase [Leucobacter luti]
MSARLKLTLSYAGFLMLAGVLLMLVVWVFLLRYVPPDAAWSQSGFMPGRDDLVRAFVPAALWALLFLLLLGLGGGWVLAGRMLAPLRRITAVTRAAGAGELAARVALDGPRDEFRELADSFDAMLARLEAHVAEQQRFAANASHELRTPLAITRAQLDVARKDPDHDGPQLVARLTAVNDRAIELTEALLLLSRSGQRAFTHESVDLSLLAEEATETLLLLAEQHGVSLVVAGEAAHAAGSPALLLQLTMNLVHNGIVHNLPADGAVWVTTGPAPGGVELTVTSTGSALDRESLATLTEPFQRGAARRRGDRPGVGLGLAIVQSIVRAHDGALALTALEPGGLRVSVWLPGGEPPREPAPPSAATSTRGV